ncbi:MAG: M12 family metallopeptidase [Saprospiraceae bacterium]
MRTRISIPSTAAFLAIFLFVSCQKEEFLPEAIFSEQELAELISQTCLTQDPADLDYVETSLGAEDRATGLKNKFWTPGQTLRVRFLSGSTALQTKVMGYAKQWESFANIKFVQVASGTSEIRIGFDNAGHWSYVGKDNLSISQSQKTMNLQFGANTTENEIRTTTLHEFGHALGLGHEHQNPVANIQWKTAAVYAYYAQMGWSQQQVNQQVLTKYQGVQVHHTTHDSKSIMQYPVPASLTLNNVGIPWNTQLSATDKDFIGKMYSSVRIRVRHAATTTSPITFALNGVQYTLAKGESVMAAAKTTGNQLGIWECVGSNCVWDNAYAPLPTKNYRITNVGTTGNMTLVSE